MDSEFEVSGGDWTLLEDNDTEDSTVNDNDENSNEQDNGETEESGNSEMDSMTIAEIKKKNLMHLVRNTIQKLKKS